MPKKTSSQSLGELKQILETIKQTLKSRGLTYYEFAKILGISESGLKKIFSSDDCSYIRLKQMTQALGVSLKDLLFEIDTPRLSQAEFSNDQQQYFLEHPKTFYFFFKLVIERQTVQELQKQMSLSDNQLFSYLKQLDKLQLIKLLPENKVKLPQLDRIRHFGDGPLLRKLYQDWAVSIAQELATPLAQKESKFIIRCLRVKEETFKELVQKLQELDSEILTKGVREMALNPSDQLKPIRWISFTDQKSMVDAVQTIL